MIAAVGVIGGSSFRDPPASDAPWWQRGAAGFLLYHIPYLQAPAMVKRVHAAVCVIET